MEIVHRPRLCAIAVAALLCAPREAFAQNADEARVEAQRLFEEASAALDRRAFDEACPKLEQVVRLQPGKIGAMLALGECYEGAGKTASALRAYQSAGAAAVVAGDARASTAAANVAELAERAPRIVIRVAEPVRSLPELVVRRDAEPIEASRWGTPLPVDPGTHEVSAFAAGKRPWSIKVTAAAGAPIEVSIPGLEDLPAASSIAPPPAARPPPVSPPPRDAPTSRGGVPTWAWAVGGIGAASTGVAVVFLADQRATQGTFDHECKKSVDDVDRCHDLASRLDRDFGLWAGFGAAAVLGLGTATYAIVTGRPEGGAGVPTWAWAAGGVGAAGAIAAVVFLADQGATQGTFDHDCKEKGYDAKGCADLATRLDRDFGLWIGFGATGVLGLGAATTYAIVSAPPRRTPRAGAAQRAITPSLVVTPGGAFGAIHGAY